MRIHFIAIGGSIMHSLAIALHRSGHQVTGSDDQIYMITYGSADEGFETFAAQLDSGMVLDKKVISSRALFVRNAYEIDGRIYFSGEISNLSGINRQGYLYVLNTDGSVSNQRLESLGINLDFNLFPNPASGPITIQWNQPSPGPFSLKLMDLNGRLLHKWEGNNPSENIQLSLDLSDIPQGTYFFNLELVEGYSTIPMIVK